MDHICVEEEIGNAVQSACVCILMFFVAPYCFFLIVKVNSDQPTKREIEKTKKQRELAKKNEQDHIEKLMGSFDKELLKEKGKDNEIQD